MALNPNNTKGESVFDCYNHQNRFTNTKDKRLKLFSSEEKKAITDYINDMKDGRNINGRKGKRGFQHLNTLLSRLKKISELLKEHYNKNIINVTSNEIHDLFDKMETGKILKTNGKPYKSTHDYIKIYKAFYRWYIKIMRKKGTVLEDITIDLSGNTQTESDFVYFNINSLKKMMAVAKFKYRVAMLFMFDSGLRSPSELMNIKKKDISEDPSTQKLLLNIRPETSKTFGRKIKLMLSSDLIKEYLETENFSNEDYIFQIAKPIVFNRYLKRLSKRIFGDKLERLKENTNNKKELTMYDFRHSSACYWLPRYKSESSMKYRFGWKKTEMIHYYSKFLGMSDTINEEDMLIDTTKTDLEKELEKQNQKNQILEEKSTNHEDKIKQMEEMIKKLTLSIGKIKKSSS